MNEETFICDICGEEHAEAACTYWDDQCFCPTCLDTLTTLCRDCGERVYRDQATPYGSEYICPRCFEDYYTICENCDAIIPYSDAYTSLDVTAASVRIAMMISALHRSFMNTATNPVLSSMVMGLATLGLSWRST